MRVCPSDKKVLISGGGIAGLTLGILLKENGWDPLVIERDPALRTEGYLLYFFGTGWDVAERIGLAGEIMKIRYPIDSLEYVDQKGLPIFPAIRIDHVRRIFGGKYTFLRRQDLERILFNRSLSAGVPIRFGTTIQSIHEEDSWGKCDIQRRHLGHVPIIIWCRRRPFSRPRAAVRAGVSVRKVSRILRSRVPCPKPRV